ncbi:hypothetical protein D3C85_1617700 [compost metagenome]
MAAQYRDIVEVQALAVTLGQGHGFKHAIHRRDLPRRALAGQGQGDGATAGAQVEDLGRCGR